jgi:hypothetical protein
MNDTFHAYFFDRRAAMNRERAPKGCVGRGGLDLFRFSLSLDDVCAARACAGDDA